MRSFVIVLLFMTAAAKIFNAADTPIVRAAQDVPHWMVIVAIQAELFVGCLLLSGWKPYIGWVAALILFFVFTIFSVYRGLANYESCACFGPLNISVWWAVALDIVILILLSVRKRTFTEQQTAPAARALFASAISYVLLGGLTLYYMIGTYPLILRAGEFALDDGEGVVLDPMQWINQEFPLNDKIVPKVDCAKGKWIVLLYEHDCLRCRNALPRYERLASAIEKRDGGAQVLLVEVPPFAAAEYRSDIAQRARLSSDRDWFVQAPIEIQLSDGKVTLASLDLPSISDIR